MSSSVGQTKSLSMARRVVGDFLHASMHIPTVVVQKEINVADVSAARQSAQPRPSWCAIFTKAYAKVVASRPELRRAYLSFPYERVFEYAETTADVVVEARQDGETMLANVPIKRADSWSLTNIDTRLASCLQDPSRKLTHYRRAISLTRLPRWLRRGVWWGLLNASGKKRARYFGTFGVSSLGNWGADNVTPVTPWTTLLHHGVVDQQGRVCLRLTFDHRVLDGSTLAHALADLEQVLRKDIVSELSVLRGSTTQDGVFAAKFKYDTETSRPTTDAILRRGDANEPSAQSVSQASQGF